MSPLTASDPPVAAAPSPSLSALTHLTTNLHLLRFPHASSLASLSLTTSANHRATDAILAFLFQHIDPQRARTTFRPLLPLTATDPGARRSFRAAAHAWLDELKHMFPGPVLLRKSVLDDGRGERFVELLASLSFHAVRCALARINVGKANEVARAADPPGRQPGGVMERRAVQLVDEYRDVLRRDVAVRQSCASLAQAYDKRLKELDEEWTQLAQRLAPVDAELPSTSDIRDQLVVAHQELADQWSRLAAAVPWESACDLVRTALDPQYKRAELSLPSLEEDNDQTGSGAVDWTLLAAAAARTLRECANATAPTPVNATLISSRVEQVARMADEAQERCEKLKEQAKVATARLEALQPHPALSSSVECGGEFPIRLRDFPRLEVQPHAPPPVVAQVLSKCWEQPLVVPPSSMSHPTLACHHQQPPTCFPAPPPAPPSRKRLASTALVDTENLHISPSVSTKLGGPHHQPVGPPSALHWHRPKPSLIPVVPFTPQQQHIHRASSVTLLSTPTSTSSSFHRPPAIWTMSPIRPSPPSPPSVHPHIVELPCGTARRVSFTIRPLAHASAPDGDAVPPLAAPAPATLGLPITQRRSSRRSTDTHRLIVDQMLYDAHEAAPMQLSDDPTITMRTSHGSSAPSNVRADVSWSTPGGPGDGSFPSSSLTPGRTRLSGAELAQQWFASTPLRAKSLVDMDASFDLDAFVSEEEGKGGVTVIGDEEMPRVSHGGMGAAGGLEQGKVYDGDEDVGDDSLLMMLES